MTEKRTLHFSITGEFITRTAREWLFIERKPYSVVEELLLSCMAGTDTPENTLKIMAQDVLLGRAEFRGNTGDGTYCYVKLDSPRGANIFAEYDKLCREYANSKEELSEITRRYVNLVDSLKMWAEGSTADALDELENNEIKRLFIDILRRYGEARMTYRAGGGWSVEFVDDGSAVEIEPPETGSPMLDSFLKQRRIEEEFEDNYGWLDPLGNFTPVEWGEHEDWASQQVTLKNWKDEWAKYGTGSLHSFGDFLVYRRGWVLLHSPSRGIATVSRDPAKPLTKAQKEFLYGYYSDRGQRAIAEQYLDD